MNAHLILKPKNIFAPVVLIFLSLLLGAGGCNLFSTNKEDICDGIILEYADVYFGEGVTESQCQNSPTGEWIPVDLLQSWYPEETFSSGRCLCGTPSFDMDVNPADLVVDSEGYARTNITVTRQPSTFRGDFYLSLQPTLTPAAGNIEELEYLFRNESNGNEWTLDIWDVTMPPGTYEFYIRGDAPINPGGYYREDITLTVPEPGSGPDPIPGACEAFTFDFTPNPLEFTGDTAYTDILITRLGGFSGEVMFGFDPDDFNGELPYWIDEPEDYRFSPHPVSSDSGRLTFFSLPSAWPPTSYAEVPVRGEGGGSNCIGNLQIIKGE